MLSAVGRGLLVAAVGVLLVCNSVGCRDLKKPKKDHGDDYRSDIVDSSKGNSGGPCLKHVEKVVKKCLEPKGNSCCKEAQKLGTECQQLLSLVDVGGVISSAIAGCSRDVRRSLDAVATAAAEGEASPTPSPVPSPSPPDGSNTVSGTSGGDGSGKGPSSPPSEDNNSGAPPSPPEGNGNSGNGGDGGPPPSPPEEDPPSPPPEDSPSPPAEPSPSPPEEESPSPPLEPSPSPPVEDSPSPPAEPSPSPSPPIEDSPSPPVEPSPSPPEEESPPVEPTSSPPPKKHQGGKHPKPPSSNPLGPTNGGAQPPSPSPSPKPRKPRPPPPKPKAPRRPKPSPPAPTPAPAPAPDYAELVAGLSLSELADALVGRQQSCLGGFDLALNTTCASQDVAPCCSTLESFGPGCLGYIATAMADDPAYEHADLSGPFNQTLGICALAVDPVTAARLDVGVGPRATLEGNYTDDACTPQLDDSLGLCAENATDSGTCCSALDELAPGCVTVLESLIGDEPELVAAFARIGQLCNLTLDEPAVVASVPDAAPSPSRRLLLEEQWRQQDLPLFDRWGQVEGALESMDD